MELEFGVPNKRKTKVDEYAGKSVLVLQQRPTKKGQSTKFELSQTAYEALDFEKDNNIALSFRDNIIYLANVDSNTPASIKLTKNRTFSNAKIYNYIISLLKLDDSVENVFNLEIEDASTITNVNSLARVIVAETVVDNEKEVLTEDQEENTVADMLIDNQPEMAEV